jgi:hypothetical protein
MLASPDFNPKFNQIDGKVDRRSHEGSYKVKVLCFKLNKTKLLQEIMKLLINTFFEQKKSKT